LALPDLLDRIALGMGIIGSAIAIILLLIGTSPEFSGGPLTRDPLLRIITIIICAGAGLLGWYWFFIGSKKYSS